MPYYREAIHTSPRQSVYIATPAYESVKAGYALSLAKTTAEFERRHIPYALNILFGNCHVDDGRNDLVRDFLENTQCTDLMFIDADVMWEPDMVLRVLSHDVPDIVAGAYRYKSNAGRYPVGKILGGVEGGKGKRALLSVSYAPTGFMRIPRGVFERLMSGGVQTGKLDPTRRFFKRQYSGKTYDGGDVTFCRKWIAAGGTVYIDPELTLGHIGEHMWSGNFSKYLSESENERKHTVDHKDPVPEFREDFDDAFRDFKAIESPDLTDFQRLAHSYGNQPWAATPEFLKIMWEMARSLPKGSTILECGTGLTTLVLALTGHKIVALEEFEKWARKVDGILSTFGLDVDIKLAAVERDWYDPRDKLSGLMADMIVIDGPRRTQIRDRSWPIKPDSLRMGILKPECAAIIDDVDDMKGNGEWEPVKIGQRPFVVGKVRQADDHPN